MIEIEVNGNISDIISSLRNEPSFGIKNETWFRGQPKYSHKLIPSLFRHEQDDGSKLFYDEAGMYEEFIRRYPDHSNSHKNVFEWLTLMQHYGLPTRLLDWTTNLLVALFFCCKENKDKDGALSAFNPISFLTTDFIFTEFLEILVISHNRYSFYEKLIELSDNKFGANSSINEIKLPVWKSDFYKIDFFQKNSHFSSFKEMDSIVEKTKVSIELKNNFSIILGFFWFPRSSVGTYVDRSAVTWRRSAADCIPTLEHGNEKY